MARGDRERLTPRRIPSGAVEAHPRLSRAELALLDRMASEEYGLPIAVLMENAGRGAAEVILQRLRDRGRAVVLAGSGNNGGDAYVVARHLANGGVAVEIFSVGESRGDAAMMERACERMGIPLHSLSDDGPPPLQAALGRADVVVDGLLGTGFHGEVRPDIARWIEAVNQSARERGTLVVALDLPSGLDADSGLPARPTIVADVTVTFAAPKIGFESARAKAHLGQVVVASIGVPSALLRRVRGTT